MEYWDYIIFIILFTIFTMMEAWQTVKYYKNKEDYINDDNSLKTGNEELDNKVNKIRRTKNEARYKLYYFLWGIYVVYFILGSYYVWEVLDKMPFFIAIIASFVLGYIVPDLFRKGIEKIFGSMF